MEKHLIQGSAEWLEMRKRHIGASDAPIIMGTSPWKTPFQLWEEKLGLRPPPETNYAMQRGNELEPIARQRYNEYTGLFAEPEVVFHPERKYMMASLDGLSLDRSVVVEIKCPGQKDHDAAAQGKIPDKYFAQLQHQLAVVGLNLLHYFSYKDGNFHLIEVPMDEEFIQEMYSKEEAFWNNIQDFSPPALSDRDYHLREDEFWSEQAKQWSDANAELKSAKAKEKILRESLINLAENKNCQGAGVKLQKVVRKGAIDYSSIAELEQINLDKHRKAPVESWRIT